MAAPSLIFFPPPELLKPVRDFAAEAELRARPRRRHDRP